MFPKVEEKQRNYDKYKYILGGCAVHCLSDMRFNIPPGNEDNWKITKGYPTPKCLLNYTEFKCHICDRIPIIKRIHEKYNCNMYNFDFKNNFNKYIKSPSYLINFKDFYDIIKNTSQIKQYKLEFNNNQTSKEIFNNYLKLLEDINNDNNYILLNKLEIINNISNNKYDDNNCSFIQLLNSFTYIPLSRLINNLEWSEIYESIWNKIYSNIEVDFNYGRDYIKDFKPVNRFELLYK